MQQSTLAAWNEERRKHKRAIRRYGADACARAYAMHLAGYGAHGIALEGPATIRTTQQADAAIAAGRAAAGDC